MTNSPQHRRIVAKVDTPFNRGVVVARGRARHLEVEGATYASYHPTKRFFGYAWDALAATALYHPLAARGGEGMTILLIGLGGGTALHGLRTLLPRAALVTAEIDEALVAVSRDHFGLDDTGAGVVVGDGYAHTATCGPKYDLILDDAFLASGEAARPQLVNAQLIQGLAQGLRPDGMLGANVFTDRANHAARLAARAAFSHAFPTTLELVPPLGHNAIVCGLARVRPLAEVQAHMEQLPPHARNAMLRIKALLGGTFPAQ